MIRHEANNENLGVTIGRTFAKIMVKCTRKVAGRG
jgi:hypothetical protein